MVHGKTNGYNILFKITQMELNHCTLYSTPSVVLADLISRDSNFKDFLMREVENTDVVKHELPATVPTLI